MLATLSPLFPVIVSGLFTITETVSTVKFTIDLPDFAVVATYLLVFNITLPFAWLMYSRCQLRNMSTLADIMGMCHQARCFADPLFDTAAPGSSKEKMDAQILLPENKYLLGQYLGRDEQDHLGFDVSETEFGGLTGTVKWIRPTKNYVQQADREPSLFHRILRRFHGRHRQKYHQDGMRLRHLRSRSEPSQPVQVDQSE